MSAFLSRAFHPLLVGVLIVQGIHVMEHVIQLIQVYVFGVADDDALGLLGYLYQFQGTEEWLHLVFNVSFLVALYLLVLPAWKMTPSVVPLWAFAAFAVGSVGLESWHVVEHGVIIANVVKNSGCPCPGIGDRVLDVTDTQLHFVYNAVAFAGVVVLARNRSSDRGTSSHALAAPTG